jgi:hypothetical protein
MDIYDLSETSMVQCSALRGGKSIGTWEPVPIHFLRIYNFGPEIFDV